jgi:hypothetical protein
VAAPITRVSCFEDWVQLANILIAWRDACFAAKLPVELLYRLRIAFFKRRFFHACKYVTISAATARTQLTSSTRRTGLPKDRLSPRPPSRRLVFHLYALRTPAKGQPPVLSQVPQPPLQICVLRTSLQPAVVGSVSAAQLADATRQH